MGGANQIDVVVAAIERGERWTAYLAYHRQTGEPLECCFKAVRNLAHDSRRPFPEHLKTHRDDPEYLRLSRQLGLPPPSLAHGVGMLALAVTPLVVGLLVISGWLPIGTGSGGHCLLGSALVLLGLFASNQSWRRLRERRLLLHQT